MIARTLNVALHPALIGFGVALYAALEKEGGLTPRLAKVAAIVSLCCLGLPLLAVLTAAKLHLTDGDRWASRKETRVYLYAGALLGLLLSFAVFSFLYPFWLAQRMTAAAVVVTVALAVVNRRLKASIHCAGDAGIAVAVGWTYGLPWGVLFGLGVPAVAWARVATRKHTVAETIAGTVVGALVTLLCLVVP